jgi:3-oxoacyl-[acyl-carrier-protein] synthase-3
MLEELLYSGKLKAGDSILCMVPESGRFITSFMQLTVVGQNDSGFKFPIREVAAPELVVNKNPTSEWLVRQLTQIWIDFETKLLKTTIVSKIHAGSISRDDYKLLLHDLRQQVIDGSQWISRAASNIDIELFELRSAFIKHTATEHKDFQILEKNFVAMGEPLSTIQAGEKNIGSVALSSFMFQQASKPNPIDLLGSMFIIEGIGKRLAGYWGELIKEQLKLEDDQVSFFTYHGVADESHFHRLEQALNHPLMDMALARRIAKTAKTTAKLYHLQLEELGNY